MTAVGYCIQNLSAVANWVAKQRWTFLEIPAVPAADAVQPKWCWRRHRAREYQMLRGNMAYAKNAEAPLSRYTQYDKRQMLRRVNDFRRPHVVGILGVGGR